MPVLSELSSWVYKSLGHVWRNEWGKELRTNVELLLTYLGSDQPWEELDEHYEGLLRYQQIQAVITSWILEAQVKVTGTAEPPSWLLRLCETWHRERATVISFNYDTLVEHAVCEAHTASDQIYAGQLYDVPIIPAAARLGGAYQRPNAASFSLLKLHGSLNWWYSGFDSPPGDAVYGTDLAAPWGEPGDVDEIRKAVADKTRLVVPPTSGKDRFYNNTVLRHQWRQARRKLIDADRIVLMGYSLPDFDIPARLLVSTAQQGCTVEVVDRDPSLVERLRGTLPDFDVVAVRGDQDVIGQYALRRSGG